MRKLIIIFFCFPFIVMTQNQLLDKGGGEHIHYDQKICLTEEVRVLIKNEIDQAAILLKESGRFPILPKNNLSFIFPLMHNPNLDYNCTYAIKQYVDQFVPGAGNMFDYSCGAQTYSGHNGTDIHTWPFPWHLSDNNQVIAVAAEEGVIVVKHDGYDDNHCNAETTSWWNAVYLEHNDGSRSWYGHLKKNSLTTKNVGETVSKGEMLGVISSSGMSTSPHLHFEVYDGDGNLIDPFQGNCNFLNSTSWWENQKPYKEPTLNAILTHDALPIHGCPSNNEFPNFSNYFTLGDSIYTAIYFHDEIQGDSAFLTIKKPGGLVWQSWTHTAPLTSATSWWYWKWKLPIHGPFGMWDFTITYNDSTISHNFYYANSTGIVKNPYENKELLIVKDLLGREINILKNKILFYIYNDGSVEKRITIE